MFAPFAQANFGQTHTKLVCPLGMTELDKWKGIASSEKSRENLKFFSCLNLGQIWGKRLPKICSFAEKFAELQVWICPIMSLSY